MEAGDGAAFLRHALEALTLHPEEARTQCVAGTAAFEAADFRTAARCFNSLAQRDPNDPVMAWALAVSLARLGDRDGAAKALALPGLARDPGPEAQPQVQLQARLQARLRDGAPLEDADLAALLRERVRTYLNW